jgi:putative redox protein
MTTVISETVRASEYPQTIQIRSHTLAADVGPEAGGADSAPDPHDYFDTALATCKALTAHWYAKHHAIPLERVETHVERDARRERTGLYHLRVRVVFHGPLSDAQRAALERAVASCPIHKLMTTSEVEIETAY